MVLRDPSIIKEKAGKQEVIMPAPLTSNLISFVWQDGELVDKSPHEYKGVNTYPNMENKPFDQMFTLKDGEYNYRGVQFKKQGLVVQLLINIDAELLSVKDLERTLALSFILLMGVGVIIASYLAVLILKPLKIIYNKQVAFVQDASHEMRTPLTILKGRLELLVRQREDKIDDHLEEIAVLMKEIRGLEKLNSDLLLMSKEDIGLKCEISRFDLNEFISDIGSFYEDFAMMQDKTLNIIMPRESIEVSWDKAKVKRCIVILIENALKYTTAGDSITLEVTKKDKFIKISVKDTGIGIKEEEQERIFDRFFRSKEVRAKGIEGSGIGLSLLKSIALGLGIRLHLESVYEEGTTFTLSIPTHLR